MGDGEMTRALAEAARPRPVRADPPDGEEGGAGVGVLVTLDLIDLGVQVQAHDRHLLLQAAKRRVTEGGPRGGVVAVVVAYPPPVAPYIILTHTVTLPLQSTAKNKIK